jgi:lysophospholipase L1-like esterase
MVVLLGVRGGILSDHYEDEYAKLAQETGAVYVSDVLDGLFAHKEYMSDEVHPNDAGYAIIADRVFRAMKGYIQ